MKNQNQNTKKEVEGKIFPSELILQGDRYFPEEYFNANCIKRDIFTGETVDLEDLFVLGTHAEGREFVGSINSQGKIKKHNEYKTWEKSICFRPIYEDDVILVGESWVDIVENPVVYFLLEDYSIRV